MKKFAAIVCFAVVSTVASQAQADCGHGYRVIYGQTSHVSYSTPVTRVVYSPVTKSSTRAVHKPTPVAPKPAKVTTTKTTTTQEVLVVKKKRLVEIPAGSVVTARVRFAGIQKGEVTVKAGKLEFRCSIIEWSANKVTFQIPQIRMPEDVEVSLTIFRANGVVAKRSQALLLTDADFQIDPGPTTLSHAPVSGLR